MPDSAVPPKGLSRRAFARALAAGGAASLALTASGLPVPAPPAPANDEASEAQADSARILARFGSRLTPAQRERIPQLVAQHLAMLTPIRALAQPNSAPPAAVLRLVSGSTKEQS